MLRAGMRWVFGTTPTVVGLYGRLSDEAAIPLFFFGGGGKKEWSKLKTKVEDSAQLLMTIM